MVGCDERVDSAVIAAATAPAAPDTAMTDRVTLEIKGAKLNVSEKQQKHKNFFFFASSAGQITTYTYPVNGTIAMVCGV